MTIAYNDLLVNWESIPNFQLWAVQVCGVPMESEVYQQLTETVVTPQDLTQWIDLWDGDFDSVAETTELYISLN